MWGWIVAFGSWLLDVLLWVPRKVYGLLLEGLATVIEAIPVGGIADALSGGWGGVGDGVLWALGLVRLDVGIPLVASAYLTRWVIRRLPLVG